MLMTLMRNYMGRSVKLWTCSSTISVRKRVEIWMHTHTISVRLTRTVNSRCPSVTAISSLSKRTSNPSWVRRVGFFHGLYLKSG